MRKLVTCLAVAGLALCCAGLARADLVGYWSANDGSGGTLTDNSGRGNDGTLTGATPPTWVPGHSGQAADTALHFTGGTGGSSSTDPYVLLGDLPDLKITGDQTISLWLYPEDMSQRRNPYAKAYGGEGTITQEKSGSISYYYGDSGSTGGWVGFSGPKAVVPNQWNYVAIVRDLTQGKVRIYVDDAVRISNTTKACVAGTRPAYIGRGYERNYNGNIDDLAVWNEALKTLQIIMLSEGLASPLALGSAAIDVTAYSYSTAPNAHSDYYRDEGKDPDEDGVWDNPTGDLTDGLFLGDVTGVTSDDTSVGWTTGTSTDIVFDLDPGHIIDQIVFGYDYHAGNGNDGPDDVQISFSTDGVTYSTPDTYSGFTGTGLSNYSLLDIPNVWANYVKFHFDGGTAHGLNKYLLDEVTFIQIPEPATLSVLAGGLVALAAGRRRRK